MKTSSPAIVSAPAAPGWSRGVLPPGQRGQVDAGDPSLGAVLHGPYGARLEARAGREQLPALGLGEQQLLAAKLGVTGAGPQAGQRQRVPAAGGDRHLQPARVAGLEHAPDEGDRPGRQDVLHVVQDEQGRRADLPQRPQQPGRSGRRLGGRYPGQVVGRRRRHRHRLQGERDVAREPGRVVVGRIQADPPERPVAGGGPLPQRGGLAVPGRRGEHDHRRLSGDGVEAREQPAAPDQATALRRGVRPYRALVDLATRGRAAERHVHAVSRPSASCPLGECRSALVDLLAERQRSTTQPRPRVAGQLTSRKLCLYGLFAEPRSWPKSYGE